MGPVRIERGGQSHFQYLLNHISTRGARHELLAPYYPHQNVVGEHMICTVVR